MLSEEKISLAEYRISKAEECLKSAAALIEIEDYLAALNRSYYAIFHSVRAVFALDGIDRKKHSGVISCFQQNYVKTGMFDKKYSSIVQEAFEVRQESDYEDFYVISKEEVIVQLENAKEFVGAVRKHINNLL